MQTKGHQLCCGLDLFRKLTFLFFIALICVSCNHAKRKTTFTVGFSQCTGADLWRKTMLEDMKTELSLHPDVNFVYTDAHDNSQLQVQQVRKMLDDKIDLLIISPNEAQPLTAIVEEAYNSGVPVIIIDRKTASSLYTAYVGADNYQIGKMAAQYLGTNAKKSLNLLEIMGLPGSSPAIERDRGFSEEIRNYPLIHVKAKIYGDWVKSNAEKQLMKTSASLRDIDAVFAHNDVMASGARTVFNKLYPGKHVEVVGVDALPGSGGGLQMVDDKILDASLVYPTGGKEAIVTALKILNREPFSRENILQSLVIDSGNVRLMKMQLNKINSQQSDILRQENLLAEQQLVYKSQQSVLDIIVISLALAIIFGGLAFYSLMENRKANKALEAKNVEIVSQRNQLIEMSARTASATEARLNFFTNVSHEFRTPLTLMLAPLQDLSQNERLTAVAGKRIELIQQNAFRLLKLVNQLIDYRKIEVDKQGVSASENNIVEFVRDIIESFRLYAQKHHIQLHLSTMEKNIKVWFDVNMLDKVFFNLLSNAIKFINGDGKVNVRIRHDELHVYIDIEDNGIGMTTDETSRIFDQFYQADHAPVMGSGIGLSLSKEIIDRHHGNVNVVSKKWSGTTFTVTLPLGNSHFGPEEKMYEQNAWPDMFEQSRIYQADLIRRPAAIEKDAFQEPREFSILIVEDNLDLLAYLSEKLSSCFEIFTADNGNDAITQAYENVPDLILSDVVLPGFSGKQVAQKLKTDIRTSHIPIVLLTAQTNIEQKISGMESMADLYVSKPFNFDFLLAGINSLLKNRKILKEHFISDITGLEKTTVAKSLDKKFINDFTGFVEQNLSNEKFNVDDICKVIGISRIQLYRKVKALLGCSITDYILNRRLKKAAYLLINENYTIAEITYEVGFSNPNYFSTVFKGKYGMTPTEFKKSNEKKGEGQDRSITF
ncbi:MAG TPA: substrate-binding domain-containing protein [Mucilaginibacter sp.]|nr:substrate-binding domain-containing protein [Mucilaginibacter sp.]